MKLKFVCLFMLSTASVILLSSCADKSTHSKLNPVDEVVLLASTDVTRLRPEYVQQAIAERASDERVGYAYDQLLKDDSDENKSALIHAIELKFIHDPDTSALDLLDPEAAQLYRNFDWQFGDYPGGPDGPNEELADQMADALTEIVPERRANSKDVSVIVRSEATEEIWQYMEDEWVVIPGQEERMLNRFAVESFVEMREAAKADGVELIALSSHRLRKTAERNAVRAGNPAAVASFSSHSLGLAVDFKMSQGDFEIGEISTRPMAEVVRMRKSPVQKWLVLNAHKFGWFPYQNEPWHWEYNPVGFREIFFSNFPGGAPARD